MLKWIGKLRHGNSSSGRSNAEWIESLTLPHDEKAIADLRTILIRGLKPALHKYKDRELDSFVEDVAQDALLKILENIQSFRGESKFTTWAMKIAVREGLSELRRKKWNDVSISELTGLFGDDNSELADIRFASANPGPDREAHESMILETVLKIIKEELSEKQSRAISALMIYDIPISVVAEQMGLKRNALYKLIHDARLNLKKKMNQKGINPDDILKMM